MGYAHIDNLYKNQDVLAFKKVYALEKVHGTSANVAIRFISVGRGSEVSFFAGGEKHEKFVALFDEAKIIEAHRNHFVGDRSVVVYGEAYGGKQQGMRATYGDELRFSAFDVKVGDRWLSVPDAADLATKLGFEFVPFRLVDATVDALAEERDRPSEVAVRRGISEPRNREGIVIRPPFEVSRNDGSRICAKHKRDEFRETASPRVVEDPAKLAVVEAADAIAREWVTPMRLDHVLARTVAPGVALDMTQTRDVVAAMIEDVFREGAGEIVDSREARRAVGKAAATMFARRVKNQIE